MSLIFFVVRVFFAFFASFAFKKSHAVAFGIKGGASWGLQMLCKKEVLLLQHQRECFCPVAALAFATGYKEIKKKLKSIFLGYEVVCVEHHGCLEQHLQMLFLKPTTTPTMISRMGQMMLTAWWLITPK